MKFFCLSILITVLAHTGCARNTGAGDGGTDGDTDSDTDTDTDADTDTQTDTLTDTDTDTDSATGSDTDACVDGMTTAGGAGTTWVTICEGLFEMGSETGDTNEMPIHSVSMPTFELTQTEVTVAQYGECVTAGVCELPDSGGNCNWADPGYEDHPVNCLKWQQALDFCLWAGGRLPSESEWEFAARSGIEENTYPWGGSGATCYFAVMEDSSFTPGCGTNRTWPVCSKADGDTDHGLCDMGGNVYEWVQDRYHSTYTDAPADGTPWEDGGTGHVKRGGGFASPSDSLRVAYRESGTTSYHNDDLGFRCAR